MGKVIVAMLCAPFHLPPPPPASKTQSQFQQMFSHCQTCVTIFLFSLPSATQPLAKTLYFRVFVIAESHFWYQLLYRLDYPAVKISPQNLTPQSPQIFFFFFWQHCTYQGSNPCPLRGKCRVITTELPGKPHFLKFFSFFSPSPSNLNHSLCSLLISRRLDQGFFIW